MKELESILINAIKNNMLTDLDAISIYATIEWIDPDDLLFVIKYGTMVSNRIKQLKSIKKG